VPDDQTAEFQTMSFGSFDQNNGQQPMAEINTTPLVDVMLVLLVIFIITAPLFQQAVPVDLPKVDATRIEDKPQVIQVALDAAGIIYWNGEPIHHNALATRLEAARGGDPELHLRADKATRYERVAEIMAAAQRAGIVKIAFVTDPAGQSR
jgi:biopolymer transport protein ExbD